MGDNYPNTSFKGFSRRSDITAHSPALDALHRLKENKPSIVIEPEVDSHPRIPLKPEYPCEDLPHRAKGTVVTELAQYKEADRSLPSRKFLYPSGYAQMTNWFYKILFFLFMSLLVGLLLWGRHKTA